MAKNEFDIVASLKFVANTKAVNVFSAAMRKASISIAAAGAAMVAMAAVAIRSAAAVNKNASVQHALNRALGLSTDLIQGLEYEFGSINKTSADVRNAFSKLNEQLVKIDQGLPGAQELTKYVDLLGISVKDLLDMKPDDRLLAVYNALDKFKDGALAANVATQLLGESGREMVGALRTQGKSIFDLAEKGKSYISETDKSREKATAFTAALDELKARMDSVSKLFYGEMGGALQFVVDGMNEFLKANKELIRTKIGEWMEKLAKHAREFMGDLSDEQKQKKIKDFFESIVGSAKFLIGALKFLAGLVVFSWIATFIKKLFDAKKSLAEFGKEIKDWLRKMKGLDKLGKPTSIFFRFYKAVKAFFALAKAKVIAVFAAISLKIALIAAAIVAVVAAIVLLIVYWDEVKEFFKEFVAGFKLMWADVSAFWSELWTDMATWVVEKTKVIWRGLQDFAIGFLNLPAKILSAWEPIKKFFSDLYRNYIRPIVDGIAAIGRRFGFGGSAPAMASASASKIPFSSGASRVSTSTANNNFSINVTGTSGMNEGTLARKIRQEIDRASASAAAAASTGA